MKGLAIGIGLAMAAALGAAEWSTMAPSQPAHDAVEGLKELEQGGVTEAPHFTKSQFSAEIEGKTKSQIRAEFGSPDRVDDGPDAWVYVSLPIFDEAAGTKAGAEIRFEGLNTSDDKAVDIHYF